MKARATIKFSTLSNREVFLKAIKPETLTPITRRSKVSINEVKDGILIKIEASDISALRASISAYVRWLVGITEALNAIKSERKIV